MKRISNVGPLHRVSSKKNCTELLVLSDGSLFEPIVKLPEEQTAQKGPHEGGLDMMDMLFV